MAMKEIDIVDLASWQAIHRHQQEQAESGGVKKVLGDQGPNRCIGSRLLGWDCEI